MTNYSNPIDGIFNALADPTRRAIVERLSYGPQSVGQLAEPFSMALPSFMQHVRILEESEIIRTEKVGRVRECRLERNCIAQVEDWLSDRRKAWETKLDGLESYLDSEQQN